MGVVGSVWPRTAVCTSLTTLAGAEPAFKKLTNCWLGLRLNCGRLSVTFVPFLRKNISAMLSLYAEVLRLNRAVRHSNSFRLRVEGVEDAELRSSLSLFLAGLVAGDLCVLPTRGGRGTLPAVGLSPPAEKYVGECDP